MQTLLFQYSLDPLHVPSKRTCIISKEAKLIDVVTSLFD
jgi:hypothetical protein